MVADGRHAGTAWRDRCQHLPFHQPRDRCDLDTRGGSRNEHCVCDGANVGREPRLFRAVVASRIGCVDRGRAIRMACTSRGDCEQRSVIGVQRAVGAATNRTDVAQRLGLRRIREFWGPRAVQGLDRGRLDGHGRADAVDGRDRRVGDRRWHLAVRIRSDVRRRRPPVCRDRERAGPLRGLRARPQPANRRQARGRRSVHALQSGRPGRAGPGSWIGRTGGAAGRYGHRRAPTPVGRGRETRHHLPARSRQPRRTGSGPQRHGRVGRPIPAQRGGVRPRRRVAR